MAKSGGDLAYIEEEQCNDQPRAAALSPPPVLPRPRIRQEAAPEVRLAIAMTADARWVRPDPVPLGTPSSPWLRRLHRVVDLMLAALTFAAQVAGVFFVIVLIAKFGLR